MTIYDVREVVAVACMIICASVSIGAVVWMIRLRKNNRKKLREKFNDACLMAQTYCHFIAPDDPYFKSYKAEIVLAERLRAELLATEDSH